MRAMKFNIHTKKTATKYFTLHLEGSVKWPKGENPTKKDILDFLTEYAIKEFKGRYTADQIVIKLGA